MQERRVRSGVVTRVGIALICCWIGVVSSYAQVVISQVYGAGGNSKALYKNDFVELFNSGANPVALSGWSLYYRAATPTANFVGCKLSGIIPAYGYYLVQLQGGSSGGGVPLPNPDTTGSIALSGINGTVALMKRSGAPTSPGDTDLVDLVGYGSATTPWYEGSPVRALSDTTAAIRKAACVWDTNDNLSDFLVSGPVPHNSASSPFVMAERSVSVIAGWNLVAVPVQQVDTRVQSCFPDALSPAYQFRSGYTEAISLKPGTGYWLKCAAPRQYITCGAIPNDLEIRVEPGWNLISTFDREMDVSRIRSVPPAIIVSDFFGYTGSYHPASQLSPGRAYWVKASRDGVLQFVEAISKLPTHNTMLHQQDTPYKLWESSEASATFASVELIDARGMRGILFIAERGEISSGYEMPPLPPEGIFDVRFADGTYVHEFGRGVHEISLSAVTFPLRISGHNLNRRSLELYDPGDHSVGGVKIEEGAPVTLRDVKQNLVLGESGSNNDEPMTFVLAQNYPNPSNPNTIIRYQLPMDNSVGSRHAVTLRVYDLLGREITVLVDERQAAGIHSVTFDARMPGRQGPGLASGVYIYRLIAGECIASGKMVLSK